MLLNWDLVEVAKAFRHIIDFAAAREGISCTRQ
jgi:hypothetical protein